MLCAFTKFGGIKQNIDGAIQILGCGFLFAFYSNYDRICSRDIFIVKRCVFLKNRVSVRSRSLEMAPFDRSHTSSYSHSIVTISLSCIVCEIWRLFGTQSRIFYTQRVLIAAAGGDLVGISWTCLMLVKLEWLCYRMVKKLWQYVKPFSSDTGTWRTDRRTDGRTDRIAISISRVSVLCAIKTGPLRLIWYSFTNLQYLLIIFCGEKPYSIVKWYDKTLLNSLRNTA